MGAYLDSIQSVSSVPKGAQSSVKKSVPIGSMTSLIAWRNLVHDRVRFIITLIGIVFSVALMGIQSGILVGFVRTTSGLVTHSDADLWIVPKGTKNVDLSNELAEQKKYLALTVPGVATAENYFVQFARWKGPSGSKETIILVGSEPDSAMAGPWNWVQGSPEDLSLPNAVVIDRLYAEKLGIHNVGETAEINNHRVRVVGFTKHVRTFTQSPYVFASMAEAQALGGFGRTLSNYVLIKTAPGTDRQEVQRALSERITDADVLTKEAFASKSENYWLFTTGAGFSLILSAILGLVVGIVIVAQTLYASTVDRLPEYATLRAMGAPSHYLHQIIIKQAILGAIFGYVIGINIVAAMVVLSADASAAIHLPWWLGVALAIVTVVMCVLAALMSIRKITTIDPVSVFR